MDLLCTLSQRGNSTGHDLEQQNKTNQLLEHCGQSSLQKDSYRTLRSVTPARKSTMHT